MLNNFLAQIVADPLDKSQYSVIDFIGIFETFHCSHFFERLQHHPAFAELPLEELTPQHQSEESLVFGHGLFVEDKIERKLAFEIKGDIIYVLRIFFDVGFFIKIELKGLRLEGLDSVDLLKYCHRI